jgi:hypothetical protein
VQWPAYWLHTWSDYTEELTGLPAAIEEADPGRVVWRAR